MKKLFIFIVFMFAIVNMQGQSAPFFFEGFEGTTGYNLPSGWTRAGVTVPGSGTNPVGGAWTTGSGSSNLGASITRQPKTGTRMVIASAVIMSGTMNAWLFSPPLTLEQGVTYSISFWYQIPTGTFPTNSFKATIGTGAAEADVIETLFTTNTNVDVWTEVLVSYTPPATGTYHLGFNDFSPPAAPVPGMAVILDDVLIEVVRDNDLAVTANVYPMAQVPVSQILVPTLSAQVSNMGLAEQTDVVLSVEHNGALVGTSAIVPTFTAGTTQTMSVTTTNSAVVLGNNTLVFTVDQLETDEDPSNNTSSVSFTGTQNEFRVDSDVNAGEVRLNSGDRAGNIFTVTAQTRLNAVDIRFTNSTGVFGATDFQVAMWPMVGDSPDFSNAVFTAVTANKPNNFSGMMRVVIPQTVLQPGNYFLAVVCTGTDLGIWTDSRNTFGRDGYIFKNTGSAFTTNAAATGGNANMGAAFVRMIVDLTEYTDLTLRGGLPYTKVPANQIAGLTFPTTLYALVGNTGVNTHTNTVFSATFNGTSIGTSAPVTIAGQNPVGQVMELTTSGGAFPTAEGTYNVVYSVASTQMPVPATAASTFEITSDVYAVDALNAETDISGGVGPLTGNFRMGNFFTITSTTRISQVVIGWEASTEAARTYSIRLFPVTGGTTIGAEMFQTANLTRPAGRGFDTIDVPGTVLTPGTYFLCVQQVSSYIGIAYDGIPGKVYYEGMSNQTTLTQNSGFGALAIRMIMDDTQNDMTATIAQQFPFPYTQIPITQNFAPFSATARNNGLATQTNVTLNVDLNDVSIVTPTSVSVAPGSTQTLTATPATNAAIASGMNALTYSVTSDFYTDPTTFTSAYTFEGTTNTYAVDNSITTGWQNGNIGNGTALGNVFNITETTVLTGVQARFNGSGGTAEIYLREVTGTAWVGNVLTQVTFTGRTTTAGWFTNTLTTPIILTPGTYFLGIRQNGTTAVSFSSDPANGKPRYSMSSAGTLSMTAPTAGAGVPCVRMIMANPCDAPSNLAVEPSRPQTQFSWVGDAASYRVNVYDADLDVFATRTTASNEVFIDLPAETTFTWDVTGICGAFVTTAGAQFTVVPDTINFEMVSITGIPTGSGVNLGKYNPTVNIKNVSTTNLGYNQIEFEIFVNGTSIGTDVTDATNIAPGATVAYTSILEVNLSVANPYIIEAVITDTRDEVAANDTATITVINLSRDAGVTEIVAVTQDVTGNWMDVVLTNGTAITNLGAVDSLRIKVKNFGQTDISGIILSATVNGVHPHTGNSLTVWTTDTDTLYVGEERYFTFPNEVNFMDQIPLNTNGLGTYNIVAWAVAATSDYDPSNDTMTMAITNQNFKDLEAVDIISPVSGTPLSTTERVTVRVANNGTWATTGLGDAVALLYAEDVLVATENLPVIAAGGSVDYEFTTKAFDLSQEGDYHFSVKINYTGDQNPHNDSTHRAVHISLDDVIDAEIEQLLSPNDGEGLTNAEIVRVRVRNSGTQPITNLPIFLQVDGGTVVPELVPSILAGQFLDYQFTATADLSAAGPHTVTVWVELPGDEDPSNDTVSEIIINTVIVDAAVLTLVTPTEGILTNAELVKVTVRNNGTFAATNVPIFYQVDGGAVVSDVVPTIAAKTAIDYQFTAPADLSAAGPHTIVVWTELPNDQNRANDTLTETVINTLVIDMAVSSVALPTATQLMTMYADNVPVTITVQNNGNTTQTNVSVYVAVNGGTPLTSSIASMAPTADGTATFNVALNPGNNAIKAWVSTPNNTSTNDTATITQTNTIDVSIQAFPGPTSGDNLGMEDVTIVLQNAGTFRIKNVAATLWVNGTSVVTETIDSINQGTANLRTYTFNAQADLSNFGPNTVRVVIAVPGNATTGSTDSTRIITNSDQFANIPYFEGFEGTTGTDLPAYWSRSGTGTNTWHTSSGALPGVTAGDASAYEGTRFMGIAYEAGSQWAYSQGIRLTAGNHYKVSFYYRAPGYSQMSEFDNFTVRMAQDQTSAAMQASTDTILHLVNTYVSNYTLAEKVFSPTTTGIYYLGFNRFTPAGQGYYIAIDNISIVEFTPIPITVSSTMPANNATDVEINAEVKVTFNQNVTLTSSAGITFTPSVTGVSANVIGNDLFIAHNNFQEGTLYTVNIAAGTIQGYANAINWTFTTASTPVVPMPDPHTLNIDVLGASATLTWQYGTAKTSGEAVSGFNIFLNGVLHGDVSATAMSYVFNSLAAGSHTAGVQTVGVAGSISDTIFVTFTVIGPITVSSTTPANHATNVELDADVKVTFNQSVTLVSSAGITITPSVTGVSASVNGTDLIIAHGNFTNDIEYTVTIPAGTIKGYDQVITWSFTTVQGNSVKPLESSSIIIYPNPVVDVLNIQTNEIIKQIFVLDMNGKVVMQQQGDRKTIDLQSIPVGNYIVRIHTETTIVPMRIVKQ
jgi:hypothetical protein